MKQCKVCNRITWKNKKEVIDIAILEGFKDCKSYDDAIGYLTGYERYYLSEKYYKVGIWKNIDVINYYVCEECKAISNNFENLDYPFLSKEDLHTEKYKNLLNKCLENKK